MRFAALCLSLCLLGFAPFAVAPAVAGQVSSPAKGSPLRSAVLDAARPIFEQETGGPIEFVVTTLNVMGEWAYGDVKLQRPGGQPINWRQTKYAEAFADDMFDPAHNLFLLRQSGSGWTLVEFALGPTDVAWDWWRQQHNISGALFEN